MIKENQLVKMKTKQTQLLYIYQKHDTYNPIVQLDELVF